MLINNRIWFDYNFEFKIREESDRHIQILQQKANLDDRISAIVVLCEQCDEYRQTLTDLLLYNGQSAWVQN